MKNRYLAGFIGLMLCTITPSFAQESFPVNQHIPDRPLFFSQLPDRFELSPGELKKILGAEKATLVSLSIAGGILFEGTVAEKIQRSPFLTSINIKLANYPGALFTLSVVTLDDNSQKIIGRIVHPKSGDVLVLVQEQTRFYFEKKQQKYFMTE